MNNSGTTTVNATEICTSLTIGVTPNTKVSDISVRPYSNIGPGSPTVHQDVATVLQQTGNHILLRTIEIFSL